MGDVINWQANKKFKVGAMVNECASKKLDLYELLAAAVRSNMHPAVTSGYLERQGIDVNYQHPESMNTALHVAISDSNRRVAEHLIDMLGANPNIQNSAGNVALHLACASSYRDMVIWLFPEELPGIDVKNNAGETPLAVALKNASMSGINYMLESCGDVYVLDNFENTLLHKAAEAYNHAEAVEWLIGAGLDVNAKNASGEMPLHICCRAGAFDSASLLIDAGAEINAADSRGDRPLDVAISVSDEEMGILLVRRGADFNVLKDDLANTECARKILPHFEDVSLKKSAGGRVCRDGAAMGL